jgi:hypothetical protein
VSIFPLDPGERFGEGLDLDDLESLSNEEIEAELAHHWVSRGPMYPVNSLSLMLDYGGPSFAKFHRWASGTLSNRLSGVPDRASGILFSTHTLTSYVVLGWETGIRNQFVVLRNRGMPVEQIMELVLFTQLYAGMRGLGHTFRAVGDFLPGLGKPPIDLPVPEGWESDPDAFKCGLDLSTREMTKSDVTNLTEWYERTIGYVPNSIRFGLKHHPEFLKPNRAKWEVAIRTLPKQFAPHLMIRQNMMSRSSEGLRESVLLGKAWGMTKRQVLAGVSNSVMFFTGIEGYYAAFDAIDDILDNWDS